MNGNRTSRIYGTCGVAAFSVFALVLCLLAIPSQAACGEDTVTDEHPLVQIRLDQWRSDLPSGVSLIVVGGGLINNGFPALSADGSKITLLYVDGHPQDDGYPTFDLYSTSTLTLQQRISFSPAENSAIEPGADASNPEHTELAMRIEGRLDDINARLSRDGFRSIPQWYERQTHGYLDSVERFGKRLVFSWNPDSEETSVTITSLATGQVELEIVMPRTWVSSNPDEPDDPYQNCGVSSALSQAWYAAGPKIVVLRMSRAGGTDDCALPDQWLLKRLP